MAAQFGILLAARFQPRPPTGKFSVNWHESVKKSSKWGSSLTLTSSSITVFAGWVMGSGYSHAYRKLP